MSMCLFLKNKGENMKKDKEISGYVKADKKARTLWGKSKQTDNDKKRQRLQSKAKTAYAERDAYAMRLNNPQTNIKQTEVKVENSFNNNFNKQKSTKVNTKAKFNWFKRGKD